MYLRAIRTSLLGFAVALAAASCHRGDGMRPAGATATTAGDVVRNPSESITAAQCQHARACEQVGTGKDFGTFEACTRDVGHNVRATFDAQKCPNGIQGEGLSNCLSAIQHERCGNPLDTIERVDSCKTSQLCR